MHSDLLPGADDSLRQSSILGDPRHRRLLAVLLERSRPVAVPDLAVELAARETDAEPPDVAEAEFRPVRIDLEHRCLPKLEAGGWIERREDGVVADEPLPFGDAGSLRADLRDRDDRFWDAVSVLVARPRRQKLASVVAERGRSLTVEELAAELAERDGTRDAGTDLAGRLHHVDLPQLAEAGLIEYDAADRRVRRTSLLLTLVDWADGDIRLTG